MTYIGTIDPKDVEHECSRFKIFCILASLVTLLVAGSAYKLFGFNNFMITITVISQLLVECRSSFYDIKRNANPLNIPVKNGDFPAWIERSESIFSFIKMVGWIPILYI